MDCASISFGIVRHYERNFQLVPIFWKSIASIICTFSLSFTARNFYLLIMQPILWLENKDKIIVFVSLLSHSLDLLPTGSDPEFFPQD